VNGYCLAISPVRAIEKEKPGMNKAIKAVGTASAAANLERNGSMKHILAAVAISVFPLLSTGCGSSSVTIQYSQIGACNGYNGSNGLVSAGANQAYVIFAIQGIDNSQNSSAFSYEPSSIGLTINGKFDAFDSSLALYHDILGPFGAVATTVQAAKSITFNPHGYGALIVQTTASDGASEANKTNYFLTYQNPPANTSVVMSKTNSSQTTWPNTPDCHTIQLQ
jgi:hypothetical protein